MVIGIGGDPDPVESARCPLSNVDQSNQHQLQGQRPSQPTATESKPPLDTRPKPSIGLRPHPDATVPEILRGSIPRLVHRIWLSTLSIPRYEQCASGSLCAGPPVQRLQYSFARISCGICAGSRWDGIISETVDGPRFYCDSDEALLNTNFYYHLENPLQKSLLYRPNVPEMVVSSSPSSGASMPLHFLEFVAAN
jgi:hypothetical protein